MRGTIRKRIAKDGTARYDVIYRAAGKQRWKTFRRRKEAETFLTGKVKSVQDGSYQQVKPKLMSEVLALWLESLETRRKLEEVKPSTAKSYRSVVKVHFIPTFGEQRSDQLTAAAIETWRAQMADRVEAGKLSRKSFNNMLNLLHSILAWARHPAQSFLAHDPLIGQKRLRLEHAEADFLEEADMTALLEAVAESPEENGVVHLGLFAGLRRGEIFGLQWGDVDAAAGRLMIRRSAYQGEITAPKTKRSTRQVDVPKSVFAALDGHRATSPPLAGHFVFRTASGAPLDPDNFYKRSFAAIRERAELRATIGLHTLRHTYASLLIGQGENPKYVSEQLGHSSIAITMDTYGHLFEKTSTKAMGRLDGFIQKTTRAAARRGLHVVGA